MMSADIASRIRRAYCVLRFAWALSRGERLARAWDILTAPRTVDLLETCRAEVARRALALPVARREVLAASAANWDAMPAEFYERSEAWDGRAWAVSR